MVAAALKGEEKGLGKDGMIEREPSGANTQAVEQLIRPGWRSDTTRLSHTPTHSSGSHLHGLNDC